jgi:hypothetical protein
LCRDIINNWLEFIANSIPYSIIYSQMYRIRNMEATRFSEMLTLSTYTASHNKINAFLWTTLNFIPFGFLF